MNFYEQGRDILRFFRPYRDQLPSRDDIQRVSDISVDHIFALQSRHPSPQRCSNE